MMRRKLLPLRLENMEDLDDYERIEMQNHDIEIDEEKYTRYRAELSDAIDAFAYYFTLD